MAEVDWMVHGSNPFFQKGVGFVFNNARLICEWTSQFSEVQELWRTGWQDVTKKKKDEDKSNSLDLVATVH